MRCKLVVAGILGGAIPVLAQVPPTGQYKETIVVTASLAEEGETALPATVDVIDRQEIEARQSTAVLDLLATLPSMSVVRSGSPGQVTSLFTRGTESNHTLALWNGIELNDPYFGGFNWAFIPTEGVARIEVARGPFSSLYGGDALGGVVQILSGRQEGVDLNLEVGGNAYRRGGLTAGMGLGPVHVDVMGHLRGGDGELDNDDFDSSEVATRVWWEAASGMGLGLTLRGLDAETGIAYSAGAPSPNRRIRWRERMVGLPLMFESGGWKLDAQLSGVTYDKSFRDPDDAFGFTASDTESQVLRARAVGSYQLQRPGSWVAFGAEGDQSQVTDSSVFGDNLDADGQSNWAIFGELYYTFGALQLDFGLRRDENDVFGGQTSPRLGLQWAPLRSTRLWASYGEAFAAPAVGELFFPVTGNPELQPETSTSWEVGTEFAHGSWQLTLVGFDNELTNLIDFDFVEFRNVNIGRARTRGVEAEVAWARQGWAVRWNASYLDARDLDTGERLLRRPRQGSNLVLRWAPRRVALTLTGRYVGEREDVDPISFARQVNAAYLRLDVAGRWQVMQHLAPYLRIENLTGETYEEALGFPAPGATLIGGLSLSYR